MNNTGHAIVCGMLAATLSAGCASTVATGALIGAGAGAAAGAGLGYAVSDEDLLGSETEGSPSGDTSLPADGSILAGVAIGAMVGAIVGAMAGHQNEPKYVRRDAAPPPPAPDTARVDPIIGTF